MKGQFRPGIYASFLLVSGSFLAWTGVVLARLMAFCSTSTASRFMDPTEQEEIPTRLLCAAGLGMLISWVSMYSLDLAWTLVALIVEFRGAARYAHARILARTKVAFGVAFILSEIAALIAEPALLSSAFGINRGVLTMVWFIKDGIMIALGVAWNMIPESSPAPLHNFESTTSHHGATTVSLTAPPSHMTKREDIVPTRLTLTAHPPQRIKSIRSVMTAGSNQARPIVIYNQPTHSTNASLMLHASQSTPYHARSSLSIVTCVEEASSMMPPVPVLSKAAPLAALDTKSGALATSAVARPESIIISITRDDPAVPENGSQTLVATSTLLDQDPAVPDALSK